MLKRALSLCLVLVLFGSLGCSKVRVSQGEEAVLIMKPWFPWSTEGVAPQPVKTGLAWIAWTTDYVTVDMKPLQFSVHFDDLMSQDGVPLDFDGVIRLRILNSVNMVSTFGEDWYKTNVEKEFMTRVRQAVRKHGMNETAIKTEAIEAIDLEVSDGMKAYLEEAHIPAELIAITVGKANPPDSVKSQRIETAAQQQRALTEAQRKLAEDARMEAEQSRAAADNAYRNAMSLDPAQFIQLEQIHMFDRVCVKHPDGSGGGCTFLVGQTGATPVIPVGKPAPPPAP